MARITIPEGLKGKELIAFVSANKTALLQQKKALAFKYSDPLTHNPALFIKKDGTVKSATTEEIAKDATSIHVKVIGNTALWMDSQSDVSLPDCWKKTIQERTALHLYDHKQNFDGEIGDVKNCYSQEMSWRDLGVDKDGTTQVYVMESEVQKDLNEKMFTRYKNKRVKQHSIGLQYVKIALAIDDEDSPKEKALWDKWIDKIGNKEAVQEQGYFFALQEIKIYENSAVIFGANSLTPTLETSDDTKSQPLDNDTDEKPFDAKSYIDNLKINL